MLLTLKGVIKNGKMTDTTLHHLAHKSQNAIKNSICRFKDERTEYEVNEAVYILQCKNCDGVYIGGTSKIVGDRSKEH